MKEVHVLNLGAGVQSTMVALLSKMGEIPKFDVAIFADTQEEPKAVYDHLAWLMASVAGHFPVLIRTAGKLGDHLAEGVNSTGGRFASIPAFTSSVEGEAGGLVRRQCTKEYKTEVIERAIRRDVLGLEKHKRVPSDVVVHQYLGLSFDEPRRIFGNGQRPGAKARIESNKWARAHFPLYDMYITREIAESWLSRQNIPHKVPRSACVFCPFHGDREWLEIKSDPVEWARVVEIDQALRKPGNVVNRNLEEEKLYLHRSCRPITEVEFDAKQRDDQGALNFSAVECEGMCGV